MPNKFTYEEHERRMREIWDRSRLRPKPNVMGSLLEKMRVRRPAAPKLPRRA